MDEDEFAEAAVRYGYSAVFQAACRRAVDEAIDVVLAWEPAGLHRSVITEMPRRRLDHE
ncbi:MAG: hypothetical protein ACRDIY_09870 [Chloroflexota bacterium]